MEVSGFLAIAAILLLACGNYARYRDPLYPPVIQSALWAGALGLLALNYSAFIPIEAPLYCILVTGVLGFSCGSYFATSGFRPRKEAREFTLVGKGTWVSVLFWGCAFALPFVILEMIRQGSQGPTESFLINIRLARIDEIETSGRATGVLGYFGPISTFSAGVHTVFCERGVSKKRCIISIVVAVVFAVSFMGRTALLLLLLFIGGLKLISRQMKPWHGLVRVGGLSIPVFVLLGSALGKGSGSAGDMWEVFRLYLLGAVPALQVYMHPARDFGLGANTLRTFAVLLAKVGFKVEVLPVLQDYVYVPAPTNVYTVYGKYCADFGLVGVLLIQVLLGFAHGIVYRKADKGKLVYVILYALSLYPLVMQCFDDQYFSLLSMWCQFIFLAVVCFGFRRAATVKVLR